MIPVEKRTRQRTKLFKALANESRCRIVEMLFEERRYRVLQEGRAQCLLHPAGNLHLPLHEVHRSYLRR